MEIQISDVEENPYQNFLDSIRDSETKRRYNNDLNTFLSLIPNSMFEHYLHYEPKTRDTEDLVYAILDLANKNIKYAKSIIRAYVRQLKNDIETKKIGAGRALNKLKPIKKLFAVNDVDISWALVDASMPKPGKSKDRSYTRKEIQLMLEQTKNLTDKVIILMFSAAGFRVEAWDFFTWKDVIFFTNTNDTFDGGALLVYRGDIEEYWTHITPEVCEILHLYREEWKNRFYKYPEKDDPLLVSVRFDKPVRLRKKGVSVRVTDIAGKIGLRPPLPPGRKRHDVMVDHGFRKYFNTMLRRAKVYWPDKEDMMGHQVGLENSYERYEPEDFEWFTEYKKAIPFLTISDKERDNMSLQQKQKKIDELEFKNKRIHDLENDMSEFKKFMRDERKIILDNS